MPTSKRMIPDQSADLFFGCLSVISDLLTSAKRADILQISLTTCSLLILTPSNVAIIVSFCHRAAQPSHCESRNRVRAGSYGDSLLDPAGCSLGSGFAGRRSAGSAPHIHKIPNLPTCEPAGAAR